MRSKAEWVIDSEPIRARGIIVKYYFIVINLCSKVGSGCHQEIWLCACCWSVSLFLGIDRASLPVHYLLTRAAASGGEGRQLPPGTVEPDKSSLWMDLFSLDSVILIVVTCICVQF